jgi:beige protein homolog 1
MSLKPVTARPRRYRSSTSASNAATTKATEVLQVLLDKTTQVPSDASGYPDITTLVNHTRQIHQHIAASEPPCPQQQDFRRLRGFERMLDILRSYSGFYDAERRSEEQKKGLFELLHVVLANLSAAFRAQPGNRRYFKDRVDDGGWDALEQTIASIGLGVNDADIWTNCQLLGKLLSFALDDQRMDDLCQRLAEGTRQSKQKEGHAEDESRESKKSQSSDRRDHLTPSEIHAELLTIITPQTRVQNPDIMRAVIGFWRSVPREQEPLSVFVLNTLSSLTLVSLSNRSALHETGIASTLLRCLFLDAERQLSQDEQKHVYTACRALASLGLTDLADTQTLIRSKSTKASDFCLNAAGNVGPPFIQFDLSHRGHSALELPTLNGTFPPQTAGYTFSLWFRIDKFDSKSHTTLFGVFDRSQTCFLLAYIEQGTSHFILQTSLRSKRPSVRFKSVVFREGQWYHLAVVHRRPKALSKSKASFYLDGEFVEQLQIGYPASPPSASSSGLSSAIFANSTSATENAVSNPVQAFLGTPAALADRESPRLTHSKWSLASAHLFEDVLSDDLLAVHYRLSPRYQGNFQDRLGGFQTYDASAALALRNETLHSESEEKSDIMRAVREKASSIFPEQKILLSILANSVISPDTGFMDSLVFRSLSRPAMHGFMELTTKRGYAAAINNAIPSISDAVLRPGGAAILAGETTVVVPYHFDDNLWRLGGFTAVALKLIERSASAEDLVRSLELTFLCINRSWRNSEAMERDNGYAILTMLLRLKTGFGSVGSEMSRWRLDLTETQRDKLGLQILSLVLDFVGYNHADPLESFIINPLAYRILLIDLDIWRKAAPITQELYYKQFVTFAVKSKHHQFNCRRILRMRKFCPLLSTDLVTELMRKQAL